ncbi:MAG: hypothetical protein K2M68_06660 [Muribaculaceae bacterium]|nr:hypothetical protein [Muribaculaceae bacterium]
MYLYKGVEVARNARRRLRHIAGRPASELVLSSEVTICDITDPGSGELALTLAILNRHTVYNVRVMGQDNHDLLEQNRYAAPNIAAISVTELSKS